MPNERPRDKPHSKFLKFLLMGATIGGGAAVVPVAWRAQQRENEQRAIPFFDTLDRDLQAMPNNSLLRIHSGANQLAGNDSDGLPHMQGDAMVIPLHVRDMDTSKIIANAVIDGELQSIPSLLTTRKSFDQVVVRMPAESITLHGTDDGVVITSDKGHEAKIHSPTVLFYAPERNPDKPFVIRLDPEQPLDGKARKAAIWVEHPNKIFDITAYQSPLVKGTDGKPALDPSLESLPWLVGFNRYASSTISIRLSPAQLTDGGIENGVTFIELLMAQMTTTDFDGVNMTRRFFSDPLFVFDESTGITPLSFAGLPGMPKGEELRAIIGQWMLENATKLGISEESIHTMMATTPPPTHSTRLRDRSESDQGQAISR